MDAREYAGGIGHIAEAVDHAITLAEGSDPEMGYDGGTGVCYYNDTFELHGFWTHESDDSFYLDQDRFMQAGMPLFKSYGPDLILEWYKRIGRSMEVLTPEGLTPRDWYLFVAECLDSIARDPNPVWKCKHEEMKHG